MSDRPFQYGSVGYAPDFGDAYDVGDEADVGDFEVMDLVDPLGMRNIPGKVKAKVDGYVESKAQRAATLAGQRVEAGVNRAVNTAGTNAALFAAGGVLAGTLVAGTIYLAKRSPKKGEHR